MTPLPYKYGKGSESCRRKKSRRVRKKISRACFDGDEEKIVAHLFKLYAELKQEEYINR